MTSVHHDEALTDEDRRAALYRGDIFLTTPDEATRAICTFARGLIEEAFRGLAPETAQDHMPVERYVDILSTLNPVSSTIPGPRELLRTVLERRGVRSRTDLLRCPLVAHLNIRWLPHVRHRVCLASPPRHLVLGAAQPAQLLDGRLPDRSRKRDGLPPGLLRHRRPQHVEHLQLLRVEQQAPGRGVIERRQ